MSIKDEIAKIKGLTETLRNEIEVWFECHFSTGKISAELKAAQERAKEHLHEILGTTPKE